MTHNPPPAGSDRFRVPRRLLAIAAWILEPERLQSRQGEPSLQPVGRAGYAWLTARDALPSRVVNSSTPKQGIFRWLLSRDRLPDNAEALRRHPEALSWLAASECLPTFDVHHPAPSRSFLRWLLTSEPEHDEHDLTHPDPSEEVQLHES